MKLGLSQLVDITKIRMLTDLLYKATGISVSIADSSGAVIADSGWQEICRNFHGISPETRQWCRQNGTVAALRPRGGRKQTFEKCRNGLVDVTAPITMSGERVADLSAGQFLLCPPDIKFFREQALHAGFDEAAYMEAVSKVPVIDEAKLRTLLQCVSFLPEVFTEAGIKNFIHEMEKREKEKSPPSKSRSLEDVNVALRALVRQKEEDKRELEENILSNVEKVI
jgi:ligand-binding sensor protein